ncbi:hypothetical protein LCGC14_2782090 [marine sediment metagenome]|uniref:Uncharacterized protein n=1 Tax=marine sediment metagenome TaxID=412755 RepID=A0A0F8YT01_9ZZZZ
MIKSTDKNTQQTNDSIYSNKLVRLYDKIDFLESEIQIYKKSQKQVIIKSIENEITILKNIKFNIDRSLDKKKLLNILFIIKIYSNLIEDIPLYSNFRINWRDLFYFSILESFSPESLIKNTIREIKRRRSYSSTKFISKIYRRINNCQGKTKKTKQISLEMFM